MDCRYLLAHDMRPRFDLRIHLNILRLDGIHHYRAALHGAATFRAQKFPSASCYCYSYGEDFVNAEAEGSSMALSNSASASHCLSRVFPCCRSLRRLASLAFIPPWSCCQR